MFELIFSVIYFHRVIDDFLTSPDNEGNDIIFDIGVYNKPSTYIATKLSRYPNILRAELHALIFDVQHTRYIYSHIVLPIQV